MTLEHGFTEVRRERPEDVAAIAHVNDAAFDQPDESRISKRFETPGTRRSLWSQLLKA